MKAIISPGALVILFIIVTAFVGFSYIVFTQFFEIPQNSSNLKEKLEISDVKGGNIVYIKNTGAKDLVTDKIKTSVDGLSVPCTFDVPVIKSDKTEICELPRKCNFGSLLRVSAESYYDEVTCPPSSGIATTSVIVTSTPSTTLLTATTVQQTTLTTTISGITTPTNLREVQQCIGNGNVEVNFQWDYTGQTDHFELAIESALNNYPIDARMSGFNYEFPSGTQIEWELTAFYGNAAESEIKTFQTIYC